MCGVSHAIDRLDVTFDDESLVANAGLIVPATLMVRLGLEVRRNHRFDKKLHASTHRILASTLPSRSRKPG